jgi:hypothetical protein
MTLDTAAHDSQPFDRSNRRLALAPATPVR